MKNANQSEDFNPGIEDVGLPDSPGFGVSFQHAGRSHTFGRLSSGRSFDQFDYPGMLWIMLNGILFCRLKGTEPEAEN